MESARVLHNSPLDLFGAIGLSIYETPSSFMIWELSRKEMGKNQSIVLLVETSTLSTTTRTGSGLARAPAQAVLVEPRKFHVPH